MYSCHQMRNILKTLFIFCNLISMNMSKSHYNEIDQIKQRQVCCMICKLKYRVIAKVHRRRKACKDILISITMARNHFCMDKTKKNWLQMMLILIIYIQKSLSNLIITFAFFLQLCFRRLYSSMVSPSKKKKANPSLFVIKPLTASKAGGHQSQFSKAGKDHTKQISFFFFFCAW